MPEIAAKKPRNVGRKGRRLGPYPTPKKGDRSGVIVCGLPNALAACAKIESGRRVDAMTPPNATALIRAQFAPPLASPA